jgi:putative oxidoreductase
LRTCELNGRCAHGAVDTMSNRTRVLVWACAIVLALVFVLVGASKVAGASGIRWNDRFTQWGYPAGTSTLVGALEILGGLGVLIPAWRRPAAMLLVALMLGAAGTHVLHTEFPRLLPPLVLGGLGLALLMASRQHPSNS